VRTGKCSRIDNYAVCNFDHPPQQPFAVEQQAPPTPLLGTKYNEVAPRPGPSVPPRKELLAAGDAVGGAVAGYEYPRREGHEACLKYARTGRCPALDNGGKCRFDHPPRAASEEEEKNGPGQGMSASVRTALRPDFGGTKVT